MRKLSLSLPVCPERAGSGDGNSEAHFRYERALTRIQRLPARARNSAKSVLGWVGCSPIPMTKYELEQAMLVGAMALTDAPVVDSPLNFVRLCGPIVEVVDDRPQYVHFTVKE